ncbi:MAG: hypothetical protein Unbinned1819contig1001_23 [Prokaryotic dsDNA virus sp.]|nr:MAG: hypothetical protein Unbinned1819contig1001_23 [Prokaryotic dsDNA virus sp.]|tara:strand:+ start:11604 stop:12701 length:1098 start_codon:yes stop_codon:yes gene_type:complete
MANKKITELTELTAPAVNDLLPIVDVSEASSANQNKKIRFDNLHSKLPDGTASAPSLSFSSDGSDTGLYRAAADQIGFTANGSNIATITAAGLQVGTGTAAAQLHLFSTDTTDQVIIENTDAGVDTAPDLVLYRNSSSPADSDNLANIEFRGRNDNTQDHVYAQITAKISDASDGTEDGIVDIMTSNAGSVSSRIRVSGQFIGINQPTPLYPLHVTESVEDIALFVESAENVSTTAGNIVLYHHRNTAAGQDSDQINSISFRSNNDAGTPAEKDYASLLASIVDASDTTEDGKLDLKVMAAGTLTSMAAITAANVTLGARPIIPTHTPSSASATGTAGEIAWDASYIYVCVASNTWKRVAVSTWS